MLLIFGVANYQLSQRGKDKYVILDEPIQNEQYGIGFKKGNDELKDLVWDEIKKLDESGEVTSLQISMNWIEHALHQRGQG